MMQSQEKPFWRYLFPVLLSIITAISAAPADSIEAPPASPDSSTVSEHSVSPADTALQPDSLSAGQSSDSASDTLTRHSVPDSTDAIHAAAPESLQTVPEMLSAENDSAAADTLNLVNGIYYGTGLGWSLGGFTLTDYWEDALPDSLGSFGLTASSFAVFPDSGSGDSASLYDTAGLVYTIKESPSIYTMSFPLALTLTSLSDTRRLSFSLCVSWMRKVLTAAIGFTGDTSETTLDYRQSINIYSVFLSASHGFRIPEEYFSIDGIERCFFTTGIDLSPCIAASIATKVNSPGSIDRLKSVRKACISTRRTLYGGAAAARVGLSMMKRINRTTATDVTASYSLQAYGYFFEKGDRVSIKDINPGFTRRNKPLFWISSRFEISIALLHHPQKQTSKP